MLVIRIELHSHRTGKTSEIARMIIANDGSGENGRGNYWGHAAKGIVHGDHMIPAAIMHASRQLRQGKVRDYPRKSKHVWNLLARMLAAMGYK
jgi:hypothetical protein